MLNTNYQTTAPIRVILVDDHELFRDGLAAVLRNEPMLEIVGTASDGQKLLILMEHTQPDIVITDVRMPVLNGIEVTKIICNNYPSVRVVALSYFNDINTMQQMMQAGAHGFLFKGTSQTEVVRAIRIVHERGFYYYSTSSCKQDVTYRMVTCPDESDHCPQFNERELSIMRLLCQEYCSKEIAVSLKTTCRAIEAARTRLHEKTGSRNLAGLVRYAIQHGIFKIVTGFIIGFMWLNDMFT